MIPNTLTTIRLLFGAPIIIALYAYGWLYMAVLVFALFALTDLIDGWYARKYGQCSEFGRIVDPAADKCFCLPIFAAVAWHWEGAILFLVPFIISLTYDVSASILRFIDKGMVTSRVAKWKELVRMGALWLSLLAIAAETTWLTSGTFFMWLYFVAMYTLSVLGLIATAALTGYSAWVYGQSLWSRYTARSPRSAFAQPAE